MHRAEGATADEVTRFRQAAQAFADGLAGALPHGSEVHFATEARGQNPFADFTRHQEEQIVLLATGGTLTSLAESGAGTLAGNAQMDVWREIVARDGAIIGDAIDRGISRRVCKALFPGKPILCRFELGREAALTPSDALDLAVKAKAAGYVIARDELADAVGFAMERDAAGMAQPGLFNGGVGVAAGVPRVHGADAAVPLENAEPENGRISPPANESARAAFAADMAEAGRMIAALLEAPDEELAAAAKAAVDALPDTLPEKPQFAAELEEAIARGYADGLEEVAAEQKESKK
jgi:hypothetical protein